MNFLHPLGSKQTCFLGEAVATEKNLGKKKSHEDPGATRKRNSWVKTQDSRMSSN